MQLKELERKNYRARARLLSALMEHGSLDGVRAAKELGAVSSVVKSMEEAGWIRVECENVYRDPVRSEKIQKLPPAKLTGEQRKVLDGNYPRVGREIPALSDSWCDRQRKDGSVYGVD